MSDLALLKSSIISLSPDAPVEDVADMLGRVEIATKALREIKALMEERVLEHIREFGPFTVNDLRYYEGIDKKTICKDKEATAEAVLEATAGDLHTFCEQLSSEPWKYGALKALLGMERWGQFFEVVERPDLKTGKSVPKLQVVNVKFLERKSA